MFCTLDCRFKPRRATKGPEEKRRCYACSTRYRVCNGRRSPVFWSVEGECLAQESYARRTYHEEPSRNCLTETTTATDKQNRTVAHGGAVLLFWSVGLFHVISFLVSMVWILPSFRGKKKRTAIAARQTVLGWVAARGLKSYLSCLFLEIMTTLEISLGVLFAGPASIAVLVNLGEPVQPGRRKRSKGWAAAVLSPPCSGV